MSRLADPGPLRLRRLIGVLVALGIATMLVALLAYVFGVRAIPLRPRSLFEADILRARLPRIALGLLAGGGLAATGAALQSLLRNPLADPYILGVSGGAAIGRTLALLVGLGGLGTLGRAAVPAVAFAGAMGAVVLIYAIARTGGRATTYSVLLAGVVFNAFAGALIALVEALASPGEARALLFWLMGSLDDAAPAALGIVATYVGLGAILLVGLAPRLNLLALGDEAAASLGVGVERTRLLVYLAGALATGVVVSACGMIGFVGLVVPHALRLVLGPDNRILVPASLLGGGAFLVLCDLVARISYNAFGTEPPVGAITALAGAPFFLYLLRRERRSVGF